ncbi:unnamed protein product [Caenorhabditis auriculariae]|uniref:Uncharacterized protein n=1 Tax=Caenorhabditis auriculariae TaxID=2777116 RepID=A0A8S1GU39_9PELO|nr:unnamed protein product [Caenorhabditis auriculariae]
MTSHLIPLFFRLCCLSLIFVHIEASAEEYRLLSDLRRNYDPYERPVANSSEPLVVSVKIYLQQILDVDEKNQVITLVAWVEYQWTDYKLKWDPSEYGGIKDIRFPGNANEIWKPDVLLYNSADENFDSTYPVNFVVSYTGHVLQVPPGILKLSCKIDITYFPFDDQMCHLKFGSWTYSGNFIDLRINGPDGQNVSEQGIDIQYYVQNGEWNLLAVPARNETNVFDDEPYPSLYFYLIIQRRTLYYGLNLIIPSLLISLMTVLEITILLSVCFFLSMVADMTPPTSEAVPLIGAFFSCCMLVVSASVVFTVLVLNLHNRKPETHEMSPFVTSRMFVDLASLAFDDAEAWDNSFQSKLDQENHANSHNYLLPNYTSVSPRYMYSKMEGESEMEQPTGVIHEMNKYMQKACLELKNISAQIKVMRRRMEEDERDEQAANDWKFAAMVVDRMCLFTFTLFIVFSTCGIMFSSPHLIA